MPPRRSPRIKAAPAAAAKPARAKPAKAARVACARICRGDLTLAEATRAMIECHQLEHPQQLIGNLEKLLLHGDTLTSKMIERAEALHQRGWPSTSHATGLVALLQELEARRVPIECFVQAMYPRHSLAEWGTPLRSASLAEELSRVVRLDSVPNDEGLRAWCRPLLRPADKVPPGDAAAQVGGAGEQVNTSV